MLELGSWEDVSGVFRVFGLWSRGSCDVSGVLGVLSHEVFSVFWDLQNTWNHKVEAVSTVFGSCTSSASAMGKVLGSFGGLEAA